MKKVCAKMLAKCEQDASWSVYTFYINHFEGKNTKLIVYTFNNVFVWVVYKACLFLTNKLKENEIKLNFTHWTFKDCLLLRIKYWSLHITAVESTFKTVSSLWGCMSNTNLPRQKMNNLMLAIKWALECSWSQRHKVSCVFVCV